MHLEEHLTRSTRITLGSILHRVGRLCRDIRNRAAVRKEQDLDRDSQASMQSDHYDEQDAGWLRVDG